ncbi:hypothetical protein KJ951_02390 [Patescibacteria group bacterium]|nr:hypothetical protein [Patescibacteria group bacterium]MBU1703230.1 hypothetical protein [Patescibacteria group bacterium]MBU1953842.1 hypothetical protein [Patescibacteria group bacterium]
MRELVAKFVELEKTVSDKYGEFKLFALFLREDADHWDLVLSADWLKRNDIEFLKYISQELKKTIGNNIVNLSKVVIVDTQNEDLKSLTASIEIEHGMIGIRNCNFFGLEIKDAFIITSRKSEKRATIKHFHRAKVAAA